MTWWRVVRLPYQGLSLRCGCCVSSLLTGLDLRLKVRRRVKITTRIPCTFPFYVIHTHRYAVFRCVNRNIIWRVRVTALARLTGAGTTLKLTTYLWQEKKEWREKVKLQKSAEDFVKKEEWQSNLPLT